MKIIMWLFIDIKNSFVGSNELLKLKNMDQSSNYNMTKWKILY